MDDPVHKGKIHQSRWTLHTEKSLNLWLYDKKIFKWKIILQIKTTKRQGNHSRKSSKVTWKISCYCFVSLPRTRSEIDTSSSTFGLSLSFANTSYVINLNRSFHNNAFNVCNYICVFPSHWLSRLLSVSPLCLFFIYVWELVFPL